MNGVGNREQFFEAVGSKELSMLRKAREYLLRLEQRFVDETDRERIIGLNRLRQELLSALLNFSRDDLQKDDEFFISEEIKRLKGILNN